MKETKDECSTGRAGGGCGKADATVKGGDGGGEEELTVMVRATISPSGCSGAEERLMLRAVLGRHGLEISYIISTSIHVMEMKTLFIIPITI